MQIPSDWRQTESPPWISASDSLQVEISRQCVFFDRSFKFQLFVCVCVEMESKDSLCCEKERLPSCCGCFSPKLAKFPFSEMFSGLSDTGE